MQAQRRRQPNKSYSKNVRTRRIAGFGLLAALAAALGLAANIFSVQDRITGWVSPGSQPATRDDIDRILSLIKGSKTLATGEQEVGLETKKILRRLLSENSTLYQLITTKIAYGRIKEAIDILGNFAKDDLAIHPPPNSEAGRKLLLAGLLATKVNYDLAVRYFRQADAANVDDLAARAMMAIVLLNQGHTDEAEAALNAADGERSSNPAILNAYGLLLLRKGQTSEAHSVFENVLAAARRTEDIATQAAALGNLGAVAHAAGDGKKARLYYRLSINVNKGENTSLDGNQYCNLGTLSLEAKNIPAAKNNFTIAYEIFQYSSDTSCLANTMVGLGIVSLAEHRLTDAEYYFEQAVAVSDKRGAMDNSILGRLNLAAVEGMRGKDELSDQTSLMAIQLILRRRSSDEYINQLTANLIQHHDKSREDRIIKTAYNLIADELNRSGAWDGPNVRPIMVIYAFVLACEINQPLPVQGSTAKLIKLVQKGGYVDELSSATRLLVDANKTKQINCLSPGQLDSNYQMAPRG